MVYVVFLYGLKCLELRSMRRVWALGSLALEPFMPPMEEKELRSLSSPVQETPLKELILYWYAREMLSL